MAPRPIGELISIISSSDVEGNVIKLFMDNLEEIFTHPQTDITNHLVHLSDNHALGLRSHLYQSIIKHASSDFKTDLLNLGIPDSELSNLQQRMCKRQK